MDRTFWGSLLLPQSLSPLLLGSENVSLSFLAGEISLDKMADNFRDRLGHRSWQSLGRMGGNGFKDQWDSGIERVGLR